MEPTSWIWIKVVSAPVIFLLFATIPRLAIHFHHFEQFSFSFVQNTVIMPSKCKEIVKELRRKMDEKQRKIGEDLRSWPQVIDEETTTTLLGAQPVQRFCASSNISQWLKNSVANAFGFKCCWYPLDIHPKAFLKITSAVLSIIGLLRFLNNASNVFVTNTQCPTLFPFNWICNQMNDNHKIVYWI